MKKNEKIAKELIRIAKSLIAADDEENLKKKFEALNLDGSEESAKKYADLCKEWNQKFPDKLPPVAGSITIK